MCVFGLCLGLQFENQGRLAGAIGLYRQAIRLHPGLDRGLVCLEAEEVEREGEREAERNAGDMEADVHVDRQRHVSIRTWDAAKQAAAADVPCSNSNSSRRGSIKRQDDAVAPPAGAGAATAEGSAEPCMVLSVPEHLLGRVLLFLDTYAVAK